MRTVSALERVAAQSVMDVVGVVEQHHLRVRRLGQLARQRLDGVAPDLRTRADWRRVDLAFEPFARQVVDHLDESETVMLLRIKRTFASGKMGFSSLSACQRAFGIVLANHAVVELLRRELELAVERTAPADERAHEAMQAIGQLLAATEAVLEFEAETLQLALEPFLARLASPLRA